MDDLRSIGSRLELFLDDWLIGRMDGVALRLHHPVPREVALDLDRPWEGPGSYDPVVMKDGDRYRLWYRCDSPRPAQRTGYAQSGDGIHWERPRLCICEFDGSIENNIVLQGEKAAMAVCVFKDGNPAASDSERFKAVGRVAKAVGNRDGLRGFTSPDGVHWRGQGSDPILLAPEDGTPPAFDSHNVAFWDPVQAHYVAYMRGFISNPGAVPSDNLGGSVRSIRRSVSADFRNWTEPELIDLGDSPVEHLYKNVCSQYYRAPHHYLMFPKRFFPARKFHEDWPSTGLSESVFMSSRDGVHWDRRFMEAFLRPGPDPDNWTDRNMYIGVGVVPTGPAEMSVYYIEHYSHPSVRLRRGSLRIDGFVSVNAPFGGGEMVTRPLMFEGGELVINYSTSVVGSLRVEVQDAEGRPIDGYRLSESAEIFGDEIERTVAWAGGGDVSSLAGRPVRLRFVMKEGDLYSMRFR